MQSNSAPVRKVSPLYIVYIPVVNRISIYLRHLRGALPLWILTMPLPVQKHSGLAASQQVHHSGGQHALSRLELQRHHVGPSLLDAGLQSLVKLALKLPLDRAEVLACARRGGSNSVPCYIDTSTQPTVGSGMKGLTHPLPHLQRPPSDAWPGSAGEW